MKKPNFINKRNVSRAFTVFGIALAIGFIFLSIHSGIFLDQEKLKVLLNKVGIFGPLVFLGLQIIQTVIPIIPGGLTNGIGVLMFGPIFGFLLNYVGNILGSIFNFLLAKRYGNKLVRMLVSDTTYEKYIIRINKLDKFDKFFRWAIFLPGFPDDALCFIAGLTPMTFKRYVFILVVYKPFNIFIYSMGLWEVFKVIFSYFGG